MLVFIAIVLIIVVPITGLLVWIILRRGNEGTIKAGKSDASAPATKTKVTRNGYRIDGGDLPFTVVGDSVWAWYRLPTVNAQFMTPEQINAATRAVVNAVSAVASQNERVPVMYRHTYMPIDVDAWEQEQLSPKAAWDPTPMYRELVRESAELMQFSKGKETVGFFGVQIATFDKSTIQRLNEYMSGEADDVVAPDIAAEWNRLARTALRALNTAFREGVTYATQADRAWLIRKTFTGCYDPDMTQIGPTKQWGPGQYREIARKHVGNERDTLVYRILNSELHPADRDLDGAPRTPHTVYLAAADWAKESSMDDRTGNWLEIFGAMNLDVVWRAELMPQPEYVKKLEKAVKNLESERNHYIKAKAPVPAELNDQHDRATQELAEARRNRREPGCEWQLLVQVSAPTRRDLEDLVGEVIRNARNESEGTIQLHRVGNQLRMETAFLPGPSPLDPIAPFVHTSRPHVLAMGGPTLGVHVGTSERMTQRGLRGWRGHLIGWDETGMPVFWSAHSSIDCNQPAGVGVYGASGGGKSNIVIYTFILDTESGARGIAVDPKGDIAQALLFLAFGKQVNEPGFMEELRAGTLGTPVSKFQPTNPRFWKDTEIVDVAYARPGSLDCFRVAGSAEAGSLLARQTLRMFLGEDRYQRYEESITEALDAMLTEYNATEGNKQLPTMWAIPDKMRDIAASIPASTAYSEKNIMEKAARAIAQLRTLPNASIVFAENPQGEIGRASRRRTVYTLRGLALPRTAEVDKWEEQQRIGAGIMNLVTVRCTQFLDNPKTVHPRTGQNGAQQPLLLHIDESYVVTSNDNGATMIKEGVAQGRSRNSEILLVDQNARRVAVVEADGDAEQQGSNTWQAIFAFQQTTLTDARGVARVLSSTNPDGVASRLLPRTQDGDLETGVCYLRDADQNLALVRIDVLWSEMARALETNPNARAGAQSIDVSPHPSEWTLIRNDPTMSRSAMEDAA